MAENLGSIRYDFDVTTAPLFKASDTVNKTTDSIVSDFKRVDSSSKSLNTQVTKTADGVKKSVHRNFGQAGIQVQQFVGQLQGGQSAMLALSQQSADLGIVLGAPMVGVIVSLGAVLLGTLLPSLMSNKTSADALAKSVESVKAVMTLGAGGVAEYTEEMEKLNKVSKQLAKIQLAQAIVEQNKVIKLSAKSVIESAQNTSKLYESTFANMRSLAEKVAVDIGGNMEDVAKAVSGDSLKLGSSGSYLTSDLDKISSKFKITREEALELGLAFSDVSKKGDAMSLKSLQNVLEDLSETYGYSNEEITKLGAGVIEFLVSANSATDGINELRGALTGTGDGIDELTGKTKAATDTFKALSDQLEVENTKLKDGERAAFQKALKMQELTDEQIKNLTVLWDENEALKKNNEARKEASDELENEIDGYIKLADAVVKSENAKKERETESNITFAQGVINKGKSPDQLMAEQYERLKQLRDTDLENAQLYQDAMTALEIQAQENRESLLAESYQRVGEQAATSMGQYLAGAKTAEEATRDLAATIITQAINSLVQMGTTALIESATTTTAATTGIAATTGAAVTSAGVMAGAQTTAMTTVTGMVGGIAGGLAAAWAPAAAFASLATLGTNAAPAIAGIYSTMAATLGAQLVGGLISSGIEAGTGFAGANMSGGREFGGPVSAGSMYRVGEKGKPEFYKDNLGNLSMIPGENGEVIPANKMGGNSGGMTVQVNNYTPYQVFVTQDQATNIAKVEIGNEASKLQKGRGNMYNAMKSGGNYKNDAKR